MVMAVMALPSCGGKKQAVITTASYHSYETECMGKSMDGKQTLRVWASGRDRNDAINEAKKKAAYEVTFQGITAGRGECNSYPIIDQPSLRQTKSEYFDKFFSDKGAYKKYVKVEIKKSDMDMLQGDNHQMYEVIVEVDRSGIRQHFIKDKVLPWN